MLYSLIMETITTDSVSLLPVNEDEMKDLLKQNPGYKDRFTQTIRFDNYTGEELTEILMGMLKAKGMKQMQSTENMHFAL